MRRHTELSPRLVAAAATVEQFTTEARVLADTGVAAARRGDGATAERAFAAAQRLTAASRDALNRAQGR